MSALPLDGTPVTGKIIASQVPQIDQLDCQIDAAGTYSFECSSPNTFALRLRLFDPNNRLVSEASGGFRLKIMGTLAVGRHTVSISADLPGAHGSYSLTGKRIP